MTTGRINQVAS